MKKSESERKKALAKALKAMTKANELIELALGKESIPDRWRVLGFLHLETGDRMKAAQHFRIVQGDSLLMQVSKRHEEAIIEAVQFTMGHRNSVDMMTCLHNQILELCQQHIRKDSLSAWQQNHSFLSFCRLEKLRGENKWLDELPVK